MRKSIAIMAVFALAAASVGAKWAFGQATTLPAYCNANPDQCRRGTMAIGVGKGSNNNNLYMEQIDPATGAVTVETASGAAFTVSNAGRVAALVFRGSYSASNVPTTAAVTLVAATTAPINRLYVFDSSGSQMEILVNSVAAVYVPPGGAPYPFELAIASGSGISIQALDVPATQGAVVLTGLN